MNSKQNKERFSYIRSKNYQADVNNKSIFSRASDYFSRKQFPVSDSITSVMDTLILKLAKILPGPLKSLPSEDLSYQKFSGKTK